MRSFILSFILITVVAQAQVGAQGTSRSRTLHFTDIVKNGDGSLRYMTLSEAQTDLASIKWTRTPQAA
jgi:hypothetical protein